tara:strand:- start:1088 stop:1660 length:573 start_codon:yes stop_codon:yes gene_type:complete
MFRFVSIIASFLFFLHNPIMAIETPNFQLIEVQGEFEIREYDPMIIAMTKVNSNYKEASSTGFRRIANYIFGGNQKKMAIEMTAPVILDVPNMNDTYEILFVMPSQHSLEELPAPDQSNIEIKIKELGKTAVIKFGGWATESRTTHYKERLQGFVENSGYSINSDYMVAQYNSPWALPPFRKNEIIVMIK